MSDVRLYRAQHKRRLSWMPWLYFRLKPKHKAWAEVWQAKVQSRLMALETVEIDTNAFVAPSARIFAEPGRLVRIGARASVAAEVFMHGPITLAAEASVNARCHIDGGSAGVEIGEGSRIATGCRLFAFDHQLAADRTIREQPVRSRGIRIGADVWLGAGVNVTDGVTIGSGAVVGMGSVVTHDVPENTVVAGVPAKPIKKRT